MCAAQSQSFEITESKTNYKGNVGDEISAIIPIKNTSDKPIQVYIKRLTQVIGTSQNNYFCWGTECYEPSIEQIPLSKKINPGETSLKFKSVLETGLVPGFSTVKYLIYDRDNPADAIEYEITFTVEDEAYSNSLFANRDINIHDVYPNPAEDFAVVEYNIINSDVDVKLVLHNVLGSIVSEYKLPLLEKKLKLSTEDLNPGVYFYTLYIDNDGVMTRKLVVKK